MDSIALEFFIPADDDGYILLQCGHCGEYFKLTAEDCENDDILRIVCPACGLESETYLTDDVIQLALTMADNYVMDLVNNMFKDLERNMFKDLERKSRHNRYISVNQHRSKQQCRNTFFK